MILKRNLTQIVRIPNPTANGSLIEKSINLDANYDKCTGWAAKVITASPKAFEIGLRNPEGQIQDPVFYQHITSNEGVAIKDRYHEIDIQAKGRQVTMQLTALDDFVANTDIQFIFRLENEKTK